MMKSDTIPLIPLFQHSSIPLFRGMFARHSRLSLSPGGGIKGWHYGPKFLG